MSPKNSLLNAGLAALGLFALAPPGAAGPPATLPPGPDAPVAPTPEQAVLLLTNGHLQEGKISDGGSAYLLHTRQGTIPIDKRRVETCGRTIRDIYEYKLGRLPERDPDEHMKLAHWCLMQRMTDEAKAQLEAVLKLSAQNRQARSMLTSILKEEDRRRIRDESVQQASAEVVESDSPRPLNPGVFKDAGRVMGISGLPEISDLPPALAVRRADEFKKYVEPVLQVSCARCHNEQFEGSFRLIWYKRKSDQTVDARRANLDAVLRFIDWENPAKSEILSSTLREHGKGKYRRPIFVGSNDRQYKILATWVNSLRSKSAAAAVAQSASPARAGAADVPGRFTGPEGGETSGFAVQRGNVAAMPRSPAPALAAAGEPPLPDVSTPLPPGQFLPSSPYEGSPYAPANTEFPTPIASGGMRPRPAAPPGAVPPPTPPGATIPPPIPFGAAATAQAAPPPGAPGTMPAGVPGPLPPGVVAAAGQAGQAGTGASTDPAAAKTSKKPIKFDPALLEKALMNRYQPKP